MDLVLLLLMLVFAISGYRQGFVIGITSLSGFFLGLLLGLQLGPLFARQFVDAGTRVLISLVAIFGLAVVGQALAGWLGSHLRKTITSDVGKRIDDIGGAFVSLFAVLLLAWLVAVPLGSSSVPWLAASVRNSALITVVNQVLPERAHQLSTALEDTVDTDGFPDVFGDLAPTRARQVDPPDPALANSQVVVNGRQSVVKVLGSAPSCSRRIEGSGFVYADDRVMTNAHVVAGTRSVAVELGGERYDGKVVVYDPDRDLAVLLVPGLPGRPCDSPPATRAAARTPSCSATRSTPLQRAVGAGPRRRPDQRSGHLCLHEGDPGGLHDPGAGPQRQLRGPLLSANGLVLGVIFAAASDDPNIGFAVTAAEARPVALAGAERNRQVGTGECT
ncbi:MarP family serine protease [Micromonospora sp. M12]